MTRSASRPPVPVVAPPAPDTVGFRSSGSSPTVHLLGAGKVGRAFLQLAPAHGVQVVAVTDASATIYRKDGLPAADLARFKQDGGRLAQLAGAESVPLPLALQVVDAPIVVDALPTALHDPRPALRRASAILQRGACLALASKDALFAAAAELTDRAHRDRLGIDAVLGGAGQRLLGASDAWRASRELVVAGNASTTAVITAVERGASIDEGIAQARTLGLLEADPTLDLDGSDALAKLLITAGLVFRRAPAFLDVPRPDLRALDPDLLRARAARGAATRLLGRATPDGSVQLGYEEVPAGAAWRVPADRVAYAALPHSGAPHVLVGTGIGPRETARVLLQDVLRLAAREVAQ